MFGLVRREMTFVIGAELPTMGIILVMTAIFPVMGMFMDWIGIVLPIIPVVLSIVVKLSADHRALSLLS